MDDWASPWAEEDQYQHPVNETKKEIKGTSVTTRPTKAGTLPLREGITSPWDNEEDDEDEEGFGEWTVPAEVKVAEGGGFQLDEGWHRDAGDQGELEDEVKELTPAWKTNPTLSDPPKLAPSPMAKHLMRQHSPDPWATEFSRNDIPHSDEEDSFEEEFLELERDSQFDKSSTTPGLQESTKGPSPQVEVLAAESLQSTESKRNSTIDVDRSSSQPSSSPSVTSQHEDGRHESPRTSMEDDINRPQISRKVSANVQELVEHFDGLVEQEGQSSAAGHDSSRVHSREHGSREVTEKVTEETVDVADFEGEAPDAKDIPEESILTSGSPSSHTNIPSHVVEPLTSITPDTSKEVISPIQASHKLYGPVNVDLDLSILDQLYPHEKSDPVEDIFIPDTVPHDSFRSTEERKMWYRISRYGPMLKHNSGDDENYVRVSWPHSTVRDDTLKIVARWMEEDRLSGHVVLGGGGKTSTLFGWGDTKAPAVSLASAFAVRNIKSPPKPLITQPTTFSVINPTSPLHPSRQILEDTPTIPEEEKPIPMPAVNFGWNSLSASSLSSNMQSPTPSEHAVKKPSLSMPVMRPPTISPASSLRPLVLPKTIVPIESPQQTPLPISASLSEISTDLLVPVARITDDEEEEDDDWGDMVSTPYTTTFENITFSKETSLGELKITQTIHDDAPHASHNQILKSKQGATCEPISRSPLEGATTPPSVVPAQQTISHILTSTTGGPWASADFSFFDSSAGAIPTPIPSLRSLPPTAPPSIVPTPPPTIPQPTLQESVTFTPLPPRTSQPPKPPQSQFPPPRLPASKPNPTTNEQEELVQSIIKGLPDISYMLRR